MRVSRERQIFLALCAVDEMVEQARAAPIRPSFALRFALAFLWSCSDGRDRAGYDALWRNLVGANGWGMSHSLLHAYARSQFNGVILSLGLDVDAVLARIDRARKKPKDYRAADRLWGSMTEQEKRDHARKARICHLDRIDQPFPTLD